MTLSPQLILGLTLGAVRSKGKTRLLICSSSSCPRICRFLLFRQVAAHHSHPVVLATNPEALLNACFPFTPRPVYQRALPALPSKCIWNLIIFTTLSANNLVPAAIILTWNTAVALRLSTSAPALPVAYVPQSARMVLVQRQSDPVTLLKTCVDTPSCFRVPGCVRSGPCLAPALLPLPSSLLPLFQPH